MVNQIIRLVLSVLFSVLYLFCLRNIFANRKEKAVCFPKFLFWVVFSPVVYSR